MHFNPKTLLVTVVFLVLLWLAINRGLGLLAIALEVLLGWGLWSFAPDGWFRDTSRRAR